MSEFKKLYQAPLPAIIALLVVFGWQGVGHWVMYMMEHSWFQEQVFLASILIGLVGAVMVWIGRNKGENPTTLLGFAGGSLIWLAFLRRISPSSGCAATCSLARASVRCSPTGRAATGSIGRSAPTRTSSSNRCGSWTAGWRRWTRP